MKTLQHNTRTEWTHRKFIHFIASSLANIALESIQNDRNMTQPTMGPIDTIVHLKKKFTTYGIHALRTVMCRALPSDVSDSHAREQTLMMFVGDSFQLNGFEYDHYRDCCTL